MELIDKEKTYKELSEYYHHSEFIQHLALSEALDRVPVVDAVPVRHGHWVGIDDEPHEVWECDMCGYIYESEQQWYNYCPYCGAKMDAEHEKTVVDINRKIIELAKESGTNWFDRDEREKQNENR